MTEETKDPKVVLIASSASIDKLPKAVEEVIDRVATRKELIVIGDHKPGAQTEALNRMWDKGKQTYAIEPSHKPDAAIVIWNGDKNDKVIKDTMDVLSREDGKVFLYNEVTGKSSTITHDQYFQKRARDMVKEQKVEHDHGLSM